MFNLKPINMKRSLFWISLTLQAIYLYAVLSQLINVFIAIAAYGFYISGDTWRMIDYDAVHIGIFYLFYLFLFPRLLFKKRIKEFIAYTLVIGILVTIYGIRELNGSLVYHFQQALSVLMNVILIGLIAGSMRGLINWIAERNYRAQLEKKNLETSLALLKAQINPHFLFNTLNNIDVLIEKEPATASVYLKKLSDILRFMLYETPNETIPLSTELDYIKTYIELQKIRTANANFVKFEVQGNADGLFIAPMIFIPFIENAFKHSTNKKMDNAIEITMAIQNDEINFSCVNVFDEVNALQQPNSGLGLELINSRLNLLYQGNHQLKVGKADNHFAVHLTINADGH